MPSEKSDQKDKHTNPRGGPTAQQKGYSTSEAIIELRDSLVGESNTNRDQENRKPKRKPTWVEIATLVLLFLTTAGLVVQDIILHSSDDTFKATLTNQKQSTERQLRAYVYVKEASMIVHGDNQLWTAKVVVRNFGQTPAYGLQTTAGFFPAAKAAKYDIPGAKADLDRPPIDIAPGQEIILWPKANGPFTPEATALFNSGAWVIFIHGELKYRDAFNNPHVTNYRMKYLPDGTLQGEEGNTSN